MIKTNEILMGREKEYPLDAECKTNLELLYYRINIIRFFYDKPMHVSSGYRPGKYNEKAGGAKNSLHMKCAAIDIHDSTGDFWDWLMKNIPLLEKLGLWLEDRTATPTWVHLQIEPPSSGKRIFKP